jgi:hypothetical protein
MTRPGKFIVTSRGMVVTVRRSYLVIAGAPAKRGGDHRLVDGGPQTPRRIRVVTWECRGVRWAGRLPGV